ncbi:hypothetical protein HD806DRAFT_473859 [Xylariaceae sp. AK1471]|nr:hypothetical protein HD806DRAFT_473859 [Xylariaceae sp. AK1471]
MTIPAEHANYVTTALSLFILSTRIILSLWRQERIDASFFLVVTSIVVTTARVVINNYYLRFGSAVDAIRHAGYFDESNLHDIKTGSILVLIARTMMTIVIWLQVSLLLLLYSRITYGISWVSRAVNWTWAAVATTFVAVVLITFLECQPFSLYWQISPDPGYCVHAVAELLVQALSNIFLDLLLMTIAWPIVRLRKRTAAEHITLYMLFALGIFCIIISIIRVVSIQQSASLQTTRSIWASVQMSVSIFVANAPSIYGSIRALRKRRLAANGFPSPAIRDRRTPVGLDSWLRMDDDNFPGLVNATPANMLRPLPPATTFYDPETAPAPFWHNTTSMENDTHQTRPNPTTRPFSSRNINSTGH